MKVSTIFISALVQILFGCASANNRAPSSRRESAGGGSGGADGRSGALIAPYAQSHQAMPQIPACSSKLNQGLAKVTFKDGPQIAGGPWLAYYLVCTLIQVGELKLNDGSIDQSKMSETRKTAQNVASVLGLATTLSVCLPATALNASLVYVFTDQRVF